MERENHLISVIIPVYNVQDYLAECVESVLKQTYKNLQIILVDDGSTDMSGRLCDEYALQDDRVLVVHKENGGLSDARNAGLDVATGDYIGYVDSDDFISENMYESLLNLCIEYDVPIACARYVYCGDVTNDTLPEATGEIQKVTSDVMVKTITETGEKREIFATVSVWDRLYRADVIKDLRFPKGKNFEDILYSTKALINAKECVYINEGLYFYRIRKGSITNQESAFEPRWLSDKLPLEKEKIEYLMSSGYKELALFTQFTSYNDLVCMLKLCDDDNTKETIRREASKMELSIWQILVLDEQIGFKLKYIVRTKLEFLYRIVKRL